MYFCCYRRNSLTPNAGASTSSFQDAQFTQDAYKVFDYYVCEKEQACNGSIPRFSTVQDAIKAAEKDKTNATNPILSQFWLAPDTYPRAVAIPQTLTAVHLRGMVIGDPSQRPTIDEVIFQNTDAITFFGLSDISVISQVAFQEEYPCIYIISNVDFQLLINGSNIQCSTTFIANATGNFQIGGNSLFGTAWHEGEHETHAVFRMRTGTINVDRLSSYSNIYVDMYKANMTVYNSFWAFNSKIKLYHNSNFTASYNDFAGPVILYSKAPHEVLMARNRLIHLQQNSFRYVLALVGLYISASVENNTLSARNDLLIILDDDASRIVPHFMPNLIVSAYCRGKLRFQDNTFINGTTFFDFPDKDNFTRVCNSVENPYQNRTTFTRNRFMMRAPDTASISRFTGLLSIPWPPALSVTTSFSLRHAFGSPPILNATGNWWGHEKGPWLCCSEQHSLITPWITSNIDASYWCTDSSCTSFSDFSLSRSCIINQCDQILSKVQGGFFGTLFAIGFLTAVVSFVVAVVLTRMHFKLEHLQNLVHEDLTRRALKIWLMSILAGSVSVVCNILLTSVLIYNNYATPVIPGQERIRPLTIVVFYSFVCIGIMQLLLNFTAFMAGLFWSRQPSFLKFCADKFYAWNVSVLCLTAASSLFWLPSEIYATRALGGAILNNVTQQSDLSWSVYAPVALGLVGSLVMIYASILLNSLLYHFDYAKINTVLEVALLKDLASSPEVHRRGIWLRTLAICTVFACLFYVATVLVTLARPELLYDPRLQFLTPESDIRARALLSLAYAVASLAALGSVIFLTFSYNRLNLLTVISIVLLCTFFGETLDGIFWLSQAFPGEKQIVETKGVNILILLHLIANPLLISLTFGTVVFLLLWRSLMLKEIPKRALANLNGYLDQVWSEPNFAAVPYIPLTLSSEDSTIQHTAPMTVEEPHLSLNVPSDELSSSWSDREW